MQDTSSTRVLRNRYHSFSETLGRTIQGRFLFFTLICATITLLLRIEALEASKAGTLAESVKRIRDLDSILDDEEEGEKGQPILVHVTGPLYTATDLEDKEFGISVRAVKLRRVVEMYQWIEHQEMKHVDNDGQLVIMPRFMYSKEWRSELINSSRFSRYREYHANPTKNSYPSKTYRSHLVKVRGLTLSDSLIDKINNFRPVSAPRVPAGFQRHREFLYRGENPHSPVVGDLRVVFHVAGEIGSSRDTVSIVAWKVSDKLQTSEAGKGHLTETLTFGKFGPLETLSRHTKGFPKGFYKSIWQIRLVAAVIFFSSISVLFRPTRRLFLWLPVLRELSRFDRSVFAALLTFTLIAGSIAVSWVQQWPGLSLCLGVLASCPFVGAWISRVRSARAAYHGD